MGTIEPAIRAKLSDSNTALFETVEDYLLWLAQIATYGQFEQYFRQAGGKGSALQAFRDGRAWDKREEVEAVMKRTPCTDGSTLFESMQKQGRKLTQRPR